MDIKKVIEKNSLLEAVLESLPEMLFIFDENRKIVEVNSEVKRFLNESYDEIQVKDTTGEILNCDFFKKEEGCGYGPFCNDCTIQNIIKEVFEKNNAVYNREGIININEKNEIKEMDILINAVPVEYLKKKYIILTLKDISQIKRYEKEKIKNLEKLAVIGSDAAGIVHDLKNPLTGIAGYLYLLEKELKNENSKKLLTKIEKSVFRIKNMLEDILHTATGKEVVDIETEKVVIIDFLIEVIWEMNEEKNIKLIYSIEKEKELEIDKEKMHNVFWNIIKNALEASKNNGEISIDIYYKDENKIIIEVKDTGDGIPKEIQEKLFKPGNSFGKKNGNGFGLVSAKKIVEAHGGNIYFKSQKGEGTSFFIEMPIKNLK